MSQSAFRASNFLLSFSIKKRFVHQFFYRYLVQYEKYHTSTLLRYIGTGIQDKEAKQSNIHFSIFVTIVALYLFRNKIK